MKMEKPELPVCINDGWIDAVDRLNQYCRWLTQEIEALRKDVHSLRVNVFKGLQLDEPEPKLSCHPTNHPQENIYGKVQCDKCGNYYEPKQTLADAILEKYNKKYDEVMVGRIPFARGEMAHHIASAVREYALKYWVPEKMPCRCGADEEMEVCCCGNVTRNLTIDEMRRRIEGGQP